ncbi:putative lysosomal cobalamin transporter [Talaromyces islandicus]|uniref:Probable lysosomal cobalamin transporter n=1 Tax=Talaromyces islandicus TaxID=28573 RepID=A0A0U1M9G4_TALIS|nr:putative lysosomal cobalamin transporter [Talaromyces islandicus]
MARVLSSLIWIVYAVVIASLLGVASVFIYVYKSPRESSRFVVFVCIITITALLATVLLQPVDVALVSSTNSSKHGQRKDWASQEAVDSILTSLKAVYYLLYGLDTALCLLVIPFTYFWYEEYDEVATQEGEQTPGKRIWAAFKYTIGFLIFAILLFLIGLFVPTSSGSDRDLDYFRRLLMENHGERTLAFALGFLITIGTCLYVIYTSTGMALFPVSLIKTSPSILSPGMRASASSRLEANRERQRQLDARCGGDPGQLSSKDRRELDVLVREERTLIRRQRLIEQTEGETQTWFVRAWHKTGAVLRPFKRIGGVILLLITLLVWVSMLLTAIDKASNSVCKRSCGYILGHITLFNPVNWAFVRAAKAFPVDYVLFTFLVLLFFTGSVVGIAAVGIRVFWIKIFQIRKAHTSLQALLLATAMLTMITLALNYSIAMIVAPQYATFGPQTFCDKPASHSTAQPDCSQDKDLIKACSETADNPAAKEICTPSVVSTFLNRVTLNFPFFGVVFFWAQFVFLGLYLIFSVIALVRTPKLNERQIDEDAEEAEEERLLATSARPVNVDWQASD